MFQIACQQDKSVFEHSNSPFKNSHICISLLLNNMELLQTLVSYWLWYTKLCVYTELKLINWESKVSEFILDCFLEVFASISLIVLGAIICLLVYVELIINLLGLSSMRILWDTNADLIDSVFLEMEGIYLISVLVKNCLYHLVSIYNILVHVVAQDTF